MLYIKLKGILSPTIHLATLSSKTEFQRVLLESVGKGHFDCRFDLLPPHMAQRIFSMF